MMPSHAFASISLALLLSACASASKQNDRFAARHGWQIENVEGIGFVHRLYYTEGDEPSTELHVYIEGDGRPWFRRDRINLRPETALPLMLRAMARDRRPSLYLTRPCYHQQVTSRACSPWYWTQGRYALEVVASMVAVLHKWIDRHRFERVALYGHSGGGTLAMLLASRLSDTDRVVTVAANLDTAAWTRFHGYSPLLGSLDPALEVIPEKVRQFHYLGADDTNVPTGIFPFENSPPRVNVRIVPGQSHQCCWLDKWAEILAETHRSTVEQQRQ